MAHPDTVTAEGEGVATKGTDHVGVSEEDVCVLPNGKKKTYVNGAFSEKLVPVATKTTYKKDPIWTEPALVAVSENKPKAPVAVGKTSGTWQLDCKAQALVKAVYVEGEKVVRLKDPTKQNHGNCVGVVKRGADFAAATPKDDGTADSAGGGAVQGPAAPKPNPKPTTGTDNKAKTGANAGAGAGTNPTPGKCELVSATVFCSHNRGEIAGVLEVVPKFAEDAITLIAGVNDVCDEQGVSFGRPRNIHPQFAIAGPGGRPSQRNGIPNSFPVSNWGTGGQAGLMAIFNLKNATPNKYDITVTAHRGTPRRFTVKSFPQAEAKWELDAEVFSKPLDKAKDWMSGKMGFKVDSVTFNITLKAAASAVWVEYEDWRACCELSLGGGVNFGVTAEVPIPLGPLTPIVSFLDWVFSSAGAALDAIFGPVEAAPPPLDGANPLGLNKSGDDKARAMIGPNEKSGFGIFLVLGAELEVMLFAVGKIGSNKQPIEPWKPRVTGEFKIVVQIKAKAVVRPDVFSLGSAIGGEAGVRATLEGQGNDLMCKTVFFLGAVLGEMTMTIMFGSIPFTSKKLINLTFRREITVFSGVDFPGPEFKVC